MKAFQFHALLALPLLANAAADYKFPSNTSQPVPFNISVKHALIDEARIKARLYRPSLDLKDDTNKDWLEGPPRAEMTALAAHWAENYDWFKTQDEINTNFSHYALTVPAGPKYNHSVPLHFVHQRSSKDGAVPILLLHGWPSSHLEWSQVIGPLVAPKDPLDQHFHVVAPDLPGYGFSPAPAYSGMGPTEMGFAFDNLMHALGYDKYGIVTTDLGWLVGMWMADIVPDSLIGHMTDF
jgi:pimeloyl-ACP methyl ester carboxylesterase